MILLYLINFYIDNNMIKLKESTESTESTSYRQATGQANNRVGSDGKSEVEGKGEKKGGHGSGRAEGRW